MDLERLVEAKAHLILMVKVINTPLMFQSPTGTSTPVYSGYCSGTEYSSTYSYAKAFVF